MKSGKITRREFVKWSSLYAASLTLAAPAALSLADEKKFPSEPIDLIVPFSVGGGTDIWMRTFAVALATKATLRHPVNIRNIPGAASLRGTGAAFKAKGDGYTLLALNPPSTPWAWYIHSPPFDIKQFRGICVYVREPGILVTHPDFKHQKYDELKSAFNSGTVKIIGSLGAGTIWHIAALLMKKRSGINWEKYVSYKGTGDVVASLFRKEIEVGIITASSALDHVRDGKLAPVALIGTDKRLASFPNVPTMNEFGDDPIKECILRRSVFAPPGIEEDRRLLLEKAFIKAQDNTIVQAQYKSLSLDPAYGTGQEADEALLNSLKVADEIKLKEIKKK